MAAQFTPEQLQALHHLSQGYHEQQQQIDALQQELQRMHAPMAAAAAGPSAGAQRGEDPLSRLNRLLSKPSVFHGEHGNRVVDWINELERIQLMLRLSARLRQKHND